MRKLKVGLIGLGCRGRTLLTGELLKIDKIEITAISDIYQDRIDTCKNAIEEAYGKQPLCSANYKDVLNSKIDCVIVATSWQDHTKITLEAMEKGIAVGCEVGGARTLDECFSLVKTYERTKTPCMLLENCCYGREELMVLNMIKQGLFGEVVYAEGGYRHDLRDEISDGIKNRHYRFDEYRTRNCENYPTHELGPIAFCLGINRGNRMTKLFSVASAAKGLDEYRKNKGQPPESFAQGDVVTTLISCANGQTITLTLDTTLPRPYSRGFHIQGTRAMYEETNHSLFIDGEHNKFDFDWKTQWNNAEALFEKYDHPIWAGYDAAAHGGHGGMDWLVLNAFFDSVYNKTQTPIDVYDMAAWMSVTALSEQSIKTGAAVEIPDFTNGMWKTKRELIL